jgi:lysophospholipase L1-like esterase
MKALVLRLALACTAILMAAAVGEAGLRVAGFHYNTYPTVQFGWPEPDAIAHVFKPDYDLFWVPRDYDTLLAQARQAHPGIVFMGDSCTYWGTYPRLTLARLHEDAAPIESGVKLGVPGWSTEQGLTQLERDILPLHPRIITVYFGWNDHWVALGAPDAQAHPSRLYYWLDQHLRLLQVYTKLRLGLDVRKANRPNRVPLAQYRANLERMAADGRRAGARVIFITAPTDHRKGNEPKYLAGRFLRSLSDLVPVHQAYIAATRAAARDSGAGLCDAAAAFRKLPPPDVYFLKDGIHLTDAGNRAMANIVAGCIESEAAGTAASVSP